MSELATSALVGPTRGGQPRQARLATPFMLRAVTRHADLVLTRLGIKYLIVEVKPPAPWRGTSARWAAGWRCADGGAVAVPGGGEGARRRGGGRQRWPGLGCCAVLGAGAETVRRWVRG
jgi:hypothetical protein